MAILRTYIFILSIFFFLGCKKEKSSRCMIPAGNTVTVERIFDSSFNTLEIRDNAVVTIRQGAEYKAEVRGGENLIDSYTTTVDGYKLIIENKTKCRWLRDQNTPYEVLITMPKVDTILFFGYGDIYSDGVLQVDTFKFETTDAVGDVKLELEGNRLEIIQHSGSVNFNLTGSFDYVYVYSISYSIINLENLISPKGFFTNAGTGDFRVNTTDDLKVKLELTGNIYYTNDPEIYIESELGSGQLIHY